MQKTMQVHGEETALDQDTLLSCWNHKGLFRSPQSLEPENTEDFSRRVVTFKGTLKSYFYFLGLPSSIGDDLNFELRHSQDPRLEYKTTAKTSSCKRDKIIGGKITEKTSLNNRRVTGGAGRGAEAVLCGDSGHREMAFPDPAAGRWAGRGGEYQATVLGIPSSFPSATSLYFLCKKYHRQQNPRASCHEKKKNLEKKSIGMERGGSCTEKCMENPYRSR